MQQEDALSFSSRVGLKPAVTSVRFLDSYLSSSSGGAAGGGGGHSFHHSYHQSSSSSSSSSHSAVLPAVEFIGPAGSGKTEMLLKILVNLIAPPRWGRGIHVDGCAVSVVLFDLSGHIHLPRLCRLLAARLVSARVDAEGEQGERAGGEEAGASGREFPVAGESEYPISEADLRNEHPSVGLQSDYPISDADLRNEHPGAGFQGRESEYPISEADLRNEHPGVGLQSEYPISEADLRNDHPVTDFDQYPQEEGRGVEESWIGNNNKDNNDQMNGDRLHPYRRLSSGNKNMHIRNQISGTHGNNPENNSEDLGHRTFYLQRQLEQLQQQEERQKKQRRTATIGGGGGGGGEVEARTSQSAEEEVDEAKYGHQPLSTTTTATGHKISWQRKQSEVDEFVMDCLSRLHIIRCHTCFQFLCSVRSLPCLLRSTPGIRAIFIDGASSFFWPQSIEDEAAHGSTLFESVSASLRRLTQEFSLLLFATRAMLFTEAPRRDLYLGKGWSSLITHRIQFAQGGTPASFVAWFTFPTDSPSFAFRIKAEGVVE